MIRIARRFGMFASLILSGVFATAQALEPPSPEPFAPERLLVRQHKYEQAIRAFEERVKKGDCRGAVCEANLAIALSKVQMADRALQQAQEAVKKIAEEPALTAWEANEIGAILFRAPKRSADELVSAGKAFRFARAHYSGRASNIAFNLAETLKELGESSEARAIQHELEVGVLIDPKFAILGDFQGVGVEHH